MIDFFVRRWSGEVPLRTLFWRDMLLVGSALNIATSVLALLLLAGKAPLGWAIVAYAAPAPYNIFLVLAVWRTAQEAGPGAGGWQLAAVLWLVCALVI